MDANTEKKRSVYIISIANSPAIEKKRGMATQSEREGERKKSSWQFSYLSFMSQRRWRGRERERGFGAKAKQTVREDRRRIRDPRYTWHELRLARTHARTRSIS